MVRFKKGELEFYKGHTPKELKKMYKKFPKHHDHMEYFIKNYEYNYVKKTWKKGKA